MDKLCLIFLGAFLASLLHFRVCTGLACDDGKWACGNGECISLAWKCDGQYDCSDKSDEKNCGLVCKDREWACGKGECISLVWKCDGEYDCFDKSDEKSCDLACDDGQWVCGNFECISLAWKCDGEYDCSDRTDEKSCAPKPCPHADDFQCKNGRCLPKSWTCDKANDCGDHSDESTTDGPKCATDPKCPATDFQCNVTKACIRRIFVCDGRRDCGDSDDSDERNCGRRTCRPSEFKCGDGRCISLQFRCDRDKDCSDGSDEKNCSLSTCAPNQFRCKGSGHCISSRYRCDGQPDCLDRSDELNCPSATSSPTSKPKTSAPTTKATTEKTTTKATTKPTTVKKCLLNFVKCKVRDRCIHSSWLCDGEADCDDGEDESAAVCARRTCSADQFTCRNGRCLSTHFRCDSSNDCGDGSDEQGCPTIPPLRCLSTTYRCLGSTKCIEQLQVCNGHIDCPNKDDESNCNTNECENQNGGCNQICTDLKNGFRCSCRPGYKLNPHNNKTCLDVDECQQPGTCSQRCQNLKGTFKCFCHEGYLLEPDLRRCRARDPLPFLVFSDRFDIRKIGTNGQQYNPIVHRMYIRNAVALEVDVKEGMVYWADSVNKTIARAPISDSHQIEILSMGEVTKPEGLALDWVARKMYWTDSAHGRIEVANLDGSRRMVLLDVNIEEPRAVAVHPNKRYIFWSNWGNNPRIERASMDGLERRVIIGKDHLAQPSGIAIDFTMDRIFWTDRSKHYVGSCNLDGGDIQVVVTHRYPFGLTVFEDFVYWTNYAGGKLFKANKFNGKDFHEFIEDFFRTMDINVYHPLAQKSGTNPCSADDSGCSHLCLPSAVKTQNYSCFCPRGMKLLTDQKTCFDPTLTTTKKPTKLLSTPATTKSPKDSVTMEVTGNKTMEVTGNKTMEVTGNNRAMEVTGNNKTSTNRIFLIVGVVGGFLVVLTAMFVLAVIHRRKRSQNDLSIMFHADNEEKDGDIKAVTTVKFSPSGTWAGKNFQNINYIDGSSDKDGLIEGQGPEHESPDDEDDNVSESESSYGDKVKLVGKCTNSSRENSISI